MPFLSRLTVSWARGARVTLLTGKQQIEIVEIESDQQKSHKNKLNPHIQALELFIQVIKVTLHVISLKLLYQTVN